MIILSTYWTIFNMLKMLKNQFSAFLFVVTFEIIKNLQLKRSNSFPNPCLLNTCLYIFASFFLYFHLTFFLSFFNFLSSFQSYFLSLSLSFSLTLYLCLSLSFSFFEVQILHNIYLFRQIFWSYDQTQF